ncbi:MAG: hypothetical protein ACO1OB_21625 [Archangium sp.]
MRTFLIAVAVVFSACAPKECVVDDPSTCPAEQTCERVNGRDTPLCFHPVVLRGHVYELGSGAAISGAQVLAVNADGAPVSPPFTSGSSGAFEFRVPTTRSDEKGTIVGHSVMLRAQAKNFVAFPSGARVSLPVSIADATREKEDQPWIFESPQTDVFLSAVDASARDLATVTGKVELVSPQPATLVALEGLGGRTTLATPDGTFTFFNVPAGAWRATAYARGLNYVPVDVVVGTADLPDVTLAKSSVATPSLSGSVQLVAGANGAGTSVVLALESTFIEALGRGEVPPGLRAPEGGASPNVTGAWTIRGIPDGRYVVLAAFENDDNVRDPDPGIAGTEIQRLTVSNGQMSGATSPAFKVTSAVELESPGRTGIDETSATPTFAWKKYPNADAYVLTVFDGLGNLLWTHDIADGNANSATYAGPALSAGNYFQWRITGMRKGAPTSHSEELRGLFIVK